MIGILAFLVLDAISLPTPTPTLDNPPIYQSKYDYSIKSLNLSPDGFIQYLADHPDL